MKPETPRPIRLADYTPPSHLVDKVQLDVSLAPRTRVRSRLAMRENPAAARRVPLVLDGEHFELESIALDGVLLGPRDYERTPASLILPRPPERPFTLDIVTHLAPDANTALQGLYRSRGVYCTQCEAQGFRRITYFIDRPDVLSVYTTRIEADPAEAPILLANGNPTERGSLDRGRRHYAVWRDPFPKPCYLFALVGGDLGAVTSTFTTLSGRKVDLAIYVERGKEARASWAMDALKRSMRWDERRFGREYDLDVFNIVAVSDFNMGAMENKGLNIFNDRLILASPDTATDAGYEAIESVVAHEYFHNWTGNRITCRDWFQLCLKEGLTVYRDQEFSADERSATVQRIADVRQLRAHQFPEDAGPLAHPVRPESYIEINNFYTATVYEKGAELVRMIATIVGHKAFRAGMDLYFERHDGEAATMEDFLACFEEAGGVSLAQFARWYAQAGTPELSCALAYDPRTKTAELTVSQSTPPTPGQPDKVPLHIPLRLGLLGGNGQDLELRLASGETLADGVVQVTKARETFRFTGVSSRPVPSLLRSFSAPVRLSIERSDRDLAFLMANDSDLFGRWQAATDYAMRILIHHVRAKAEGRRSDRGEAFAKALGATVGNEELDPAYRAEMLRLPTESDIAREVARNIDPGHNLAARRQVMRLVATSLGDLLEDLYERHGGEKSFRPDARSAGKRALRNAALSLLAARNRPADRARVLAHYRAAGNMTDQAHALYLLAQRRGADRDGAIADFYSRWKSDNLVIDTWFAAQAAAPLASTVATVERLMQLPQFSLTAPNKVRALIGTFAGQNPSQFNRPDGAGYDLVARIVRELDAINPQVAARLLGAFRSWRSLEAGRRRLARKALARIAKAKGLSRDVYEIVTKTLE